MKKIKSFIRLLSLTLFGLIGFSIISCENTTDIPSIESSSPTSEPIHTHEWNEGEVTKEATCIEEGQITYSCTGCDEVKSETISALGHKEVIDNDVAPTCTATGLTEGKHCDRCNKVLVAQEVIPALGHSYGDWEVPVEPGCESVGTKRRDCEACDYYEEEEIAALGHVEVIDKAKEATCTRTGLTEGSHCDRCKEVLVAQKEVAALGHDYESVVTNPTCVDRRYTTHTCNRCDDSYIDSYVEALGHSYGDWEVAVEPGCESEGTKRRDCKKCDYYEEEEIAALGHVEVIDKAIEPTCTETGLTEGKHCDRCKEVLVAQEVIPALGHSYGDWEVAVEPGCESEGTKRRDCKKCDHYEEEEIAALGHNFIDYVCNVCGYEYYSKGLVFTDYGGYYALTNIGTATDTDIVIPSKFNGKPVKIIESYAFKDCISIKKVTIGENVNWIGDFSFSGCSSLAIITIPNSVTEIGCYAFEMCCSLINIKIPKSVKTINSCAFYYCVSLESITIPNTVTRIGEGAFWGCESLSCVIIPDSVKNIHNNTFFGCNSLTSITISNSVRNFGNHSFDGCSSLKEVYYTGSEEQWNIINIGTNNEFLTNATIHFAKEEINYTEELIYELSSDETYYSVKDIGTLTDSNIIIPETYNGLPVKIIEFEAFCYCSWLTSVTIGNNVTSIESYAFIGCSSLTNVTIGHNVNWIGDYAFSGCDSLASIRIPDSVSEIGSYAFEMCTSLTDVYYLGTEEQWNSIIIGNDNEILLNATIHYNYSE